jgi:hypothetical protein
VSGHREKQAEVACNRHLPAGTAAVAHGFRPRALTWLALDTAVRQARHRTVAARRSALDPRYRGGRARRRAVGGVRTVPVGTSAFQARAQARGSVATARGATRR